MAKRILIVDDERPIADMLELALLDEGYSARKTVQPLRFFDEVREFRPALILLDLMMPYLDGADQIHLMHLSPETSRIPIIMITGSADAKEHEDEYLALGVRRVMLKPVDLNEVLATVRATIGAPEEPQL